MSAASSIDIINKISSECLTFVNEFVKKFAETRVACDSLVRKVKQLLNSGVSLDTPDSQSRTPLTQALRTGVADLVLLMLVNGASPNFPEPHSSFSPLQVVLLNADSVDAGPLVRVLLSYGADVAALRWRAVTDAHESDAGEAVPSDLGSAISALRLSIMEEARVDNCSTGTALARLCEKGRFVPVSFAVHYWLTYCRELGGLPEIQLQRTPPALRAIQLLGTVGQRLAKTAFVRSVAARLNDRENRLKPLVLAFCGNSGHGKTEMAMSFATACGPGEQNALIIDCAIEADSLNALIGSGAGYVDSDKPGKLNTFFCRNSSRDAVLVLDEFDRASRPAQEAMLSIFDRGTYSDRRNGNKYDLKRLIVILTTNAADAVIGSYVVQNKEVVSDARAFSVEPDFWRRHALALDSAVRLCLNEMISPELTGRIDAIVPFVFFSAIEASVIADQQLSALHFRLYRVPNELRELGRINVIFKGDVGHHFAHLYFQPGAQQQGARTIISAIERRVHEEVFELYRIGDINGGRTSIDEAESVWVWPLSQTELAVGVSEPAKVWRKTAAFADQSGALCDALREKELAEAAKRDAESSQKSQPEDNVFLPSLGPEVF